MSTGIALAAGGLALMASFVSADRGYLAVLPGLIAMGLGAGLAMTPGTEGITSSLPRAQQGVASALNDITREFGTALGVALLGTIVTAGCRHWIDGHLTGVPGNVASIARQGAANAVSAAPQAGTRSHDLIVMAKQAFVHGWQEAMWVGVGVMVALPLFVIARGGQPAPAAAGHDNAPQPGALQPSG